MTQGGDRDLVEAFHRLVNAAEDFVNRAPRAKRTQAERAAVLDAIAHAQLLLSVHQLPQRSDRDAASSSSPRTAMLQRELTHSRETVHNLEARLRSGTVELETLRRKVEHAKALLDSAVSDSTPDTQAA